MSKSADNNMPTTIDSESMELVSTPSRIDFKSIDDVRLEMARVYREMRSKAIETQDGTRLVYVLAAMGKLIELHEIEVRISKLEEGIKK